MSDVPARQGLPAMGAKMAAHSFDAPRSGASVERQYLRVALEPVPFTHTGLGP